MGGSSVSEHKLKRSSSSPLLRLPAFRPANRFQHRPSWQVPAERMKLARAKKAHAMNDHVVPLSAAAVAVLREAGGDTSSDPPFFKVR